MTDSLASNWNEASYKVSDADTPEENAKMEMTVFVKQQQILGMIF